MASRDSGPPGDVAPGTSGPTKCQLSPLASSVTSHPGAQNFSVGKSLMPLRAPARRWRKRTGKWEEREASQERGFVRVGFVLIGDTRGFVGKEKVKARKRRDSEDRVDPTGLRGPWQVRPPPASFSQRQFLGQGWVASDPQLPGPCVHGTRSRGGDLRDVPLCPLHLYVLHEKLDPPHTPSDQQPLAGAGAEPVPLGRVPAPSGPGRAARL